MKKICTAVSLVLCFTLLFTACGKNENGNENKSNNGASGGNAAVANEAYFEWDMFETSKITGYSEEGLKQKEITIPARCKSMSYGALQDNAVVEKIYFESNDIQLGDSAFRNCPSLNYIELPEGLPEIYEDMFWMCSSLENITIPDSVTKIGDKAFYSCGNLKTVKMGNSVTEIGREAFSSCKQLTSITFPTNLEKIGEYAFAYNDNLEQVDFKNTKLREIGKWAFYNCHKFTKVELPNTLTSLGTMSFTYCDGLNEIYLPESLQTVETGSFGQRNHEIRVYVVKDSPADVQFDTYADGTMVKKYY